MAAVKQQGAEMLDTNREFIGLLKRQKLGDESAIDAIHNLQPSADDGELLHSLVAQWRGAFSYLPGRREALEPILTLAEKIPRWKSCNVAYLYRQPEWSTLCELRGPIEFIEIYRCGSCERTIPVIRISAFVGDVGHVCLQCGNVHLRYYKDDSPLPKCPCGSSYEKACSTYCPTCEEYCVKDRTMSGFEYFERHSYCR